MKLRFKPDWPLLGKELVEQAASPRTYLVRTAYAVLLFGLFCFYYQRALAGNAGEAFGSGLAIFRLVVTLQFGAILVFLPPLMAGAIAREKERDSLALLFLTDLTPWDLILQKYLGRLIPMGTFMLLSLPLMGIAYSLGGVSPALFLSGVWFLVLTCLFVGALALMFSAYQPTTLQALLSCYLLGAVFAVVNLFPTYFLSNSDSLSMVVFNSILVLCVACIMLNGARKFLYARAFIARRSHLSYQFRLIDNYWKDVRKLVRGILRTSDMDAYAAAARAMQHNPVPAWRGPAPWYASGTQTAPGNVNAVHVSHTQSAPPPANGLQTVPGPRTVAYISGIHNRGLPSRRALFDYLFRRMEVPGLLSLTIIIGTFVGIGLLSTCLTRQPGESPPVPVVLLGFWIIALLTVPIQSANAIANERMNQRLEVLLVSPLTGPEILRQKMEPVRRWMRLLAVPLLALCGLEAWTRFSERAWDAELAAYLGISVLSVLIFLPLAHWSAAWIGLKVRSQMRALLMALAVMLLWWAGPSLLLRFVRELGDPGYTNICESIESIGPWGTINGAEYSPYFQNELCAHWPVSACAFLAHGAALLAVRWHCLRNVDKFLGRIEDNGA